MSNKVKYLCIENYTYYFFHDFINRNNFDPNINKRGEKSSKNIPIYFFLYVTIKDWEYVKTDIVISLRDLINICRNE